VSGPGDDLAEVAAKFLARGDRAVPVAHHRDQFGRQPQEAGPVGLGQAEDPGDDPDREREGQLRDEVGVAVAGEGVDQVPGLAEALERTERILPRLEDSAPAICRGDFQPGPGLAAWARSQFWRRLNERPDSSHGSYRGRSPCPPARAAACGSVRSSPSAARWARPPSG